MIRLSFGGNGRQTDSQTDSIDDGFMIPLPILRPPPPPLPDGSKFTAGTGTVGPLSGPTEDSFAPPLHCRARRPSLAPPRPSFCLAFVLLALRLSPSPHRFPFCLSLKMHPRVLMLPIKDSHNSDTVTNKPRSELPFPAPVDPPAESHQSQAS